MPDALAAGGATAIGGALTGVGAETGAGVGAVATGLVLGAHAVTPVTNMVMHANCFWNRMENCVTLFPRKW